MKHFGEFKGPGGYRLSLDVGAIESVQESVPHADGRPETIVITERNSHILEQDFDTIQAIRAAAGCRNAGGLAGDMRDLANLTIALLSRPINRQEAYRMKQLAIAYGSEPHDPEMLQMRVDDFPTHA